MNTTGNRWSKKNRLDAVNRRNLLLTELRPFSGWDAAMPDGGLFVFANIVQLPDIECAPAIFYNQQR